MAAKKSPAKAQKSAESGVVSVERYWTRSGEPVEGTEESLDELIEVPIFDGAETGRVSATLGMTLNMGNYESVKISISCSLPHYVHPEEQEAAYGKALEFAKAKLQEQVRVVKGKINGSKGG